MKKLFFVVLIVLLSISLTGCSQKEIINEPLINLYYSKDNIDQIVIVIKDNDIINLDELESTLILFDIKWSYEIESIMSSPKLPKVELQNLQLRYSLYLDNVLIENNINTPNPDEYKEHEFMIYTSFFKTTALIGENLSKTIYITTRGTYIIEVQLNIKVDDVIKNYSKKLEFRLE